MGEPHTTPADTEQRQDANEVVAALSRLLKGIDDYSKYMQAHYGVSGPQLWVLWELKDNGPVRIGQVARRMYLHPSTLTAIADRLEERGLIARSRDKQDHRVVHLTITDEGRRLAKSCPEPVRYRFTQVLTALPTSDLAALERALTSLCSVLNGSAPDAP
jgi:DNA-binding MarR family transcriptional regulator